MEPASKRETPSIVIPYVSAYGYTAELAEKLKQVLNL